MPSLTSCQNHPRFPAVGVCPKCGVAYCERCMTYRGTRYICKGCAVQSAPEGALRSSGPHVEDELQAEAAVAKTKPRRTRSRFDLRLRIRHLVKRMILFGLLGLGVVAAYLPALSSMALENTYNGVLFGPQHAPRVALLSARIHVVYRRPDDAIIILEQSLEKLPEHEQALSYFYLGSIYLDQKDTELSTQYLETFLKRWPRHDYFIEAGQMLKKAERIDKLRLLNDGERPADIPAD